MDGVAQPVPEAGAVCGSSARTDLCGVGSYRCYRDLQENTFSLLYKRLNEGKPIRAAIVHANPH